MKKDSYNPSGDLKKRTIGGFKWATIERGASVIVQFIIGVVLARLLPPEDFGLIGLAMIIVGFSQIAVDLGLGPALIQRKNITERHVRVCFTTSALLGITIAIIVFLIAPFIAKILGTAKVIPIVKAFSLLFIFRGLQISSFSLLQKKMNFKALFFVNILKSSVYGVLTIILALRGWGVWSLVIGNIAKDIVSLSVNYFFARHSIIPLLAIKELKDLSHFGVGMTINKIFNYFALRGDYFLIGRILGPYSLGIYTKAYRMMHLPGQQVINILSKVLFPAASVIQDDKKKSKRLNLHIEELQKKHKELMDFIGLKAYGKKEIVKANTVRKKDSINYKKDKNDNYGYFDAEGYKMVQQEMARIGYE